MGLKPCHLGSRAFAMLEAEYLCKMLRALRGSLAGLRFVTSFWCSTADSIYLATWSLYLEDSCRLGIGQAEQGNNKTCTRHSVGMFTAGTDVLWAVKQQARTPAQGSKNGSTYADPSLVSLLSSTCVGVQLKLCAQGRRV